MRRPPPKNAANPAARAFHRHSYHKRNLSKVGDTLKAEVEPADAKDVAFQWYADGKEIAGENTSSYTVKVSDAGVKLSVKATVGGKSITSAETSAVEAPVTFTIEAEQDGQKKIKVSGSDAFDMTGDFVVTKNGDELSQDIDPQPQDAKNVILTLVDKISAGSYEVTYTSSDGETTATATFEGENSELSDVHFRNEYLIMKDNNYREGYAYLEGVDQFGDNFTLSAANIIPSYGHFKSYEAATGKVTIYVDDDETNFALVPSVSIFVNYQQGSETKSTQGTLKVVSFPYVDSLEFGNVVNADGTVVDFDSTKASNLLKISDLKSNKCYVELLNIKDQYGNPLNYKDLDNQQKNNTLFVIPDSNTTSAYYSTGKFGQVKKADGTYVDVLYLAPGADMPGKMDLIITGAGGTSQNCEIQIADDPYINYLTVNLPTIYYGDDETEEVTFSAVDQYGDEITDLYQFCPEKVGDKLVFTDNNRQVRKSTEVAAPSSVAWKVYKDALAKTFKVTIDPNGAEKGATLVFMITSASMKQVQSLQTTVSQRTNGESIINKLGAAYVFDAVNNTVDLNQKVGFMSSNGTEMDRVENTAYPTFVKASSVTANANNEFNIVNAANASGKLAKNKPVFYYTVSKGAPGAVRAATGVQNAKVSSIYAPNNVTFNETGEITIADIPANSTYLNVYVTLYKVSVDDDSNGIASVIDSEVFRFTEAPSSINDTPQYGIKYTPEVKREGLDADGLHYVVVALKATNQLGETYEVPSCDYTMTLGSAAGNVTVSAPSAVAGYTITQKKDKTGTADLTFYVDEAGTGAAVKVQEELSITYGYTATPTKAYKGSKVNDVSNGLGLVMAGKTGTRDWMDESGDVTQWASAVNQDVTVTVTNTGDVTISNGNKLGETVYLGIRDQKDQAMGDNIVTINGTPVVDFIKGITGCTTGTSGTTTLVTTTTGTINYSNLNDNKYEIEIRSSKDTLKKVYTLEVDGAVTFTNIYERSGVKTIKLNANSTESFKAALAAAADASATKKYEITLTDTVVADAAVAIPAFVKVIIPTGGLLSLNGGAFTLNVDADGAMEIAGALLTGGAGNNQTDTVNGTVTINSPGIWTKTGGILAGAGKITGSGHMSQAGTYTNTYTGEISLTGNTYEIKTGADITFSGAATIKGHVDVVGDIKFTGAAKLSGDWEVEGNFQATGTTPNAVVLQDGFGLVLEGTGAISAATYAKIEDGATISITTQSGTAQVISDAEDDKTSGIAIATTGVVTGDTANTGANNAATVSKSRPQVADVRTVMTKVTGGSTYGTPAEFAALGLWEDLAIGASEETASQNASTKAWTITKTYKVTGTLNYHGTGIAADLAYAADDGSWYIGLAGIPDVANGGVQSSKNSKTAKSHGGPEEGYQTADTAVAACTAGTNNNDGSGEGVWALQAAGPQFFAIQVTYEDGTIVNHVYDLSRVTFGAAS